MLLLENVLSIQLQPRSSHSCQSKSLPKDVSNSRCVRWWFYYTHTIPWTASCCHGESRRRWCYMYCNSMCLVMLLKLLLKFTGVKCTVTEAFCDTLAHVWTRRCFKLLVIAAGVCTMFTRLERSPSPAKSKSSVLKSVSKLAWNKQVQVQVR